MQEDGGDKKNKHATVKKNIDAFFGKIRDHAFNSFTSILFPVTKVENDANGVNEKKAANGEEHVRRLPLIACQNYR